MAQLLPGLPHQADDRLDPAGVMNRLRPMVTAGALSLGLFALSAAISYAAISRAPPAITTPLFVYIALFVVAWATVIAILVVRRPAHAEMFVSGAGWPLASSSAVISPVSA